MSDEATGKSGRTWLYVVGWLVAIPLIYLLSIGPAVVLVERKVVAVSAAQQAYAPILLLMQATETGPMMEAYIHAWLRLTGTPIP